MSKVIVVAVHPDDETLGCGGTLLKHKAKKDKIYWLIATTLRKKQGFSDKDLLQRKRQIGRVAGLYGFDGIYELGIPTTQVDKIGISRIVKKVSAIFLKVKPNVIYLPFKKDVHSDHKAIFEAAYSCTKVFRYPFIKKILMMETISETEFAPALRDSFFIPNYFVDVTGYLDKKLNIMKVFKDEIGNHPFPRSLRNIKAMATFRGAMAGCKYAEAFVLLKDIE